MNFAIISENFHLFLGGLSITLQMLVLSIPIGSLLAIGIAWLMLHPNALVRLPTQGYVYFFRGTPLLIQLFMIYYGLGQFEFIRSSPLWVLLKEPYFCALLALALNNSAYTAEILRGAIKATSHHEIEAAYSMGMSRPMAFFRIILPSGLRRSIPAYSNEVIFMLHGTVVVSLVTLYDITGVARFINSRYYSPYEAFITAGLMYLVITFIIIGCFKLVERKYLAYAKV